MSTKGGKTLPACKSHPGPSDSVDPFQSFKSATPDRSLTVPRELTLCAFLLCIGIPVPSSAQAPSPEKKAPAPKVADSSAAKPGTPEKRVERYLRNLYAWGPEFDVNVGPSKPSPIA